MNLEECTDLPGFELIKDGIEKLKQGEETETSLLVAIGSIRLRTGGLVIPMRANTNKLPEHQLYALLAQKYQNGAHSHYNGLVRRLISFERALETRQSHRKTLLKSNVSSEKDRE